MIGCLEVDQRNYRTHRFSIWSKSVALGGIWFSGERGGHVMSTDKNLSGGEYLDLERPAMLVTCNKHVL